jgi:hypothetical protein
MGIAVQNDGGFRGFRVADSRIVRGAGRLISTASDGINVSAIAGDIIVENNEVAYQGDDGINVSPSAQSITTRHLETIGVTANCTPNPRDLAVTGDALAFFDGAARLLGTARIGGIEGSACSAGGAASLTLACADSSNCSSMVTALTSGESFIDLTQQPVARYVIRHNHFHENRGQGTQAGAPYGEIIGNTYFRNSMGAINVDAAGLSAGSVLVSGNTMK